MINVKNKVCHRVWNQISNLVWSDCWSEVRLQGILLYNHIRENINDRLWIEVWRKKMINVRNKVLDQVSNQVYFQVYDQVWVQVLDQVWGQVRGQVWIQVRHQVYIQVWDQVWNDIK